MSTAKPETVSLADGADGTAIGDLVEALFAAQFLDGRHVGDRAVLADVAASIQEAIVDGDIETGVMATGVVGGRIADVPSCQELVDRIMAEARARLDALAG